MAIRAYKQRIYPNAAQRVALNQYFGIGRWVWNFTLAMLSKAYARRKDKLNYIVASRLITILKKTSRYSWLGIAPADLIAQKLRDLDRAYINFFAKRAKYPRFKRKGHAESIRLAFDQRHGGKVKAWQNGDMVLPKLGTVKLSEKLSQGMPKMITISRSSAGRYYASYAVEEAIKPLPKTDSIVGIDMGIASLASLSNGETIENPRFLKKMTKTLRIRQKSLSRKAKGSSRWHKQRQRVAVLHANIRDSRSDYLHKATTQIVKNHDLICVESLHVKGMVRNHRLARSIHDTSMSNFLDMLRYKCEWYGKEFIEISQWFPSSKTCSHCGHKLDELNLSIREWVCPKCMTKHDRDINAATNILMEGLRVRAGSPNLDKDAKNRVELGALAAVPLNDSETTGFEARIVFDIEPMDGTEVRDS